MTEEEDPAGESELKIVACSISYLNAMTIENNGRIEKVNGIDGVTLT